MKTLNSKWLRGIRVLQNGEHRGYVVNVPEKITSNTIITIIKEGKRSQMKVKDITIRDGNLCCMKSVKGSVKDTT